MRVCVRARARARVCVCVREREREKEAGLSHRVRDFVVVECFDHFFLNLFCFIFMGLVLRKRYGTETEKNILLYSSLS